MMTECEKLLKCPFFNDKLNNMPSVSELLKQKYCLGDKFKCARYEVSRAGFPVPPDMFPNDSTRAREILKKG